MTEEVPTIVSIQSKAYGHAILADAQIKQMLRKAVLANKKFRAVLEYDPEGKTYFFIKFPEPNTSPEGRDILQKALQGQGKYDGKPRAGDSCKNFLSGRLNLLDLVISDMRRSLLEEGSQERLENQGN